jgi:hypothetical protein
MRSGRVTHNSERALAASPLFDLRTDRRPSVHCRETNDYRREVLQDGKSLLMDSMWKVHPAEQSLEPRLGPDEVELGSRIQVGEEPTPLLVGFFQGVERLGLIP